MLWDKNRDLHFNLKETNGKLSQSNLILPFKNVNLFPIRLFPILYLAVFVKFDDFTSRIMGNEVIYPIFNSTKINSSYLMTAFSTRTLHWRALTAMRRTSQQDNIWVMPSS